MSEALVAVIQEAWVSGVSTRRVDDLVQAIGLSGIGKSTVSKPCKDIEDRVGASIALLSETGHPCGWMPPTSSSAREAAASQMWSASFLNEGAVVRLIGAVLLQANDEWQLQHRYRQTEVMAEFTPPLIEAHHTSPPRPPDPWPPKPTPLFPPR